MLEQEFARSEGKVVLRNWLQSRHPGVNIATDKRGFTVPVGPWIKERADRLAHLLPQQPGLLEICRPGNIKEFFLDLKSVRHECAAWIILYYALWHQIHVLRRPVQATVDETLAQ